MDFFTQPKGSTIGVLKDGRTVQEAFDSLMYTEVTLKSGRERTPRPIGYPFRLLLTPRS